MKEAIKKILEKPVVVIAAPHADCIKTYIVRECRERLVAEIAALIEGLSWVSVKDRLPDEDGMLVAVFCPEGASIADLWPARWDAVNKCFSAGGGWFETNEVTHWIRLPELPKEEVCLRK